MGKIHRPRHGSLQFWPRKKAAKIIPSVNWRSFTQRKIEGKNKFLGFIGYKAGMVSLVVKDNTNNSMTKGKNIVIPATVIECPPIKVLSIRFYKGNNVASEVLSKELDKELKRKIKLPKKELKPEEFEGKLEQFSDIRLLVYSVVKKTNLKKTPDISEMGLSGSIKEKFDFAKSLLGKEIGVEEVFEEGQLLDTHSVTKGKGTQGPVKRFGINLKFHKSEKGQRRPGSLGPWHPARVIYRVPMAGQLGFFTRVQYNNKIIKVEKEWNNLKGSKEKSFLNRYGEVKAPFCLIRGSISGPKKRAIVLTYATRPSKDAIKDNFEFVEII
ncbi:50S ribosomal protein L3 [Nanoarchaeota archaeon]